MTFHSNRPRQFTGQKAKPCFFCKEKQEATFKDIAVLCPFISERGKILGRVRSGLCRRHQKGVTQEIKRARLLSLLR